MDPISRREVEVSQSGRPAQHPALAIVPAQAGLVRHTHDVRGRERLPDRRHAQGVPQVRGDHQDAHAPGAAGRLSHLHNLPGQPVLDRLCSRTHAEGERDEHLRPRALHQEHHGRVSERRREAKAKRP